MLTNISIWTECFAMMAAILVAAYPDKMSHFFLYLYTITKASRTFEGSTWASYNMAFHCQAVSPSIGERSTRHCITRHLPEGRNWYRGVGTASQTLTHPRSVSTPWSKQVSWSGCHLPRTSHEGLDACHLTRYAGSSIPPGAPGADSCTATTYTSVKDASTLTQLLSVVRAVASPAPRHLAARHRASVAPWAYHPLRLSKWEPTPHLSGS